MTVQPYNTASTTSDAERSRPDLFLVVRISASGKERIERRQRPERMRSVRTGEGLI